MRRDDILVKVRGRLRWFGHVERMGDGDWVKRVTSMGVEGVSARGTEWVLNALEY